MPEEINRLVTDRLSDLLLTPDTLSVENLKKEGISDNKIIFVGNIMIDTLEANKAKAFDLSLDKIIKDNFIDNQIFDSIGEKFALMTMHRPSNVDEKEVLTSIIRFLLDEVTEDMSIIWPIHPRTQKQLKNFSLWDEVMAKNKIILLHPLGYHDMLKLNMEANIMLTDSGGLQEECTILGTPCLTLRWNTERPITLKEHGGTSVLVGNNVDKIRKEYKKILLQNRISKRPELWDGETAVRCLKAILDYND